MSSLFIPTLFGANRVDFLQQFGNTTKAVNKAGGPGQ